ncbi:MAG: radical SAM protein [Victivallales bacterium]|nr:radical SAM protein [Victivallales bacterium]
MRIALITPPLLQPNTPYTAVPVLTNFLRSRGHEVSQHDFSIEVLLRTLTPETIAKAAETAKSMRRRDDALDFFIESAEDYANTIADAIAFLQGRKPELAWRIASRNYLPEGPYFVKSLDQNDDDGESALLAAYGTLGTTDMAKYLASLFLDDVASFIAATLAPDFGFAKYAEHLSLALDDFSAMEHRLSKHDIIDGFIEELTAKAMQDSPPDFVGITVPFPGTLYGAFKIASTIRRLAPSVRIVLGGGYVNSELRSLTDKRVFSYFDYICYDEGFQPWLAILEDRLAKSDATAPGGTSRVMTKDGLHSFESSPSTPLLVPDYKGLDLSKYFPIVEMPNRMHRIWTDDLWLKMQVAQGCYWHRCAFCDLDLDYICRYQPAAPKDVVDAMEKLIGETGKSGFHFVDEAISPALVRGICEEILHRRLTAVWWGNIRFDRQFTPELAELMADAGCIAVTGGLECANDRLLKLMNKGITLSSARAALEAFSNAGIMVHAYLMYGFPSQTEEEAFSALKFVRDCFADGILHSAFWHRFALTAHSPIAAQPDKFGIRIPSIKHKGPRFALNELPFEEPGAPDWEHIGKALSAAVYNYMLGLGLDMPIRKWLKL